MTTRYALARSICAAVSLMALVGACSSTRPPTGLGGLVRHVVPSRESVMYVTATLAFVNESGEDVEVTRYRISWPGGSVVLEADGLVVAAGATLERTARIDPNAGDLSALLRDPSRARVEVVSARA